MIMYQNENYEVNYVEGILRSQYQVINRITGGIEFESQQLPKALGAAEEFNLLLVEEVHKKIKDFHPMFAFMSDEEEEGEEIIGEHRSH